jgi:hypothetical protein
MHTSENNDIATKVGVDQTEAETELLLAEAQDLLADSARLVSILRMRGVLVHAMSLRGDDEQIHLFRIMLAP